MRVRIARFTHEGVKDAEVSVHPFTTDDGLGLSLTRFHRADCDDVVLLVHGLTSSSDMFIMPEHRNLATLPAGRRFTDVWTLDFRMSNRFPYDTETHRYTLDDIAGTATTRRRCASCGGTSATGACTSSPTASARCRSR